MQTKSLPDNKPSLSLIISVVQINMTGPGALSPRSTHPHSYSGAGTSYQDRGKRGERLQGTDRFLNCCKPVYLTLRCAACSLCWHRLLQTLAEDLELLNRWKRRRQNRALEPMRVTFPSQYNEPSVLLTTVSSLQIVSLLCTSWRCSLHLSYSRKPVPFSPVTHSSKTVTVFLVTSFLWASKSVK